MDPFNDPFSNQQGDPFSSFSSTSTPSLQNQMDSFDPFGQTETAPQLAAGNSFDPFASTPNNFDAFATPPHQLASPSQDIAFDPFAPLPPQQNSPPTQQQQQPLNFDAFAPSPQPQDMLAPNSKDDLDDFFNGGASVTRDSLPTKRSSNTAQTVEDLDIWGTGGGIMSNNTSGPMSPPLPPVDTTSSPTRSSKSSSNMDKITAEFDDGDDEEIQLELQTSLETYEVVFPYETKLGMLLERFEELELSTGGTSERTIVKMVIEGGAADTRGVKLGSKLVALNETLVIGKSYFDTLEMVKSMPRPLKIVMEQVGEFMDASQGHCFVRKDMGYAAPSSIGAWQKQYFVIGGVVAKSNVLQIYDSKQDYEEVVVNVFQNKGYSHINRKAYKLSLGFRCGPCATKTYSGKKSLTYFWLKNPKSNFKVLKIASENSSIMTGLRLQITKHASQA